MGTVTDTDDHEREAIPIASDRLDTAATWLAGSFSIVAGALTAVGATGGTLERVLRNHEFKARAGFFLVAVAIAAAACAKSFFVHDPTFPRLKRWSRRGHRALVAVVGGSQESLQRRLLLVGGISFCAGLFLLTDAAAQTPADIEKPSVGAAFEFSDRGVTLKGTVTAGGLPASDTIHTIATGLRHVKTAGQVEIKRTRLYESRSGPDSSGKFKLDLSVPVPSGMFSHIAIVAAKNDAEETANECITLEIAKRRDGCLILKAPGIPDRPQLEATWDLGGTTATMVVNVAAEGLRRTEGIFVFAVGESTAVPRLHLYSAFLAPGASGGLKNQLRVPVGATVESVCIAATAADVAAARRREGVRLFAFASPKCPPAADLRTTWARLAVPEPVPQR